MGWKGTVRSVSASMRRAERDAQRRYKQRQKEVERVDSAAAVEDWQDFIRDITSLHADHAEVIDWAEIANSLGPVAENPEFMRTAKARQQLDEFKRGRLDFLRGGTEKRRSKLVSLLAEAEQQDAAENLARAQAFGTAKAEWIAEKALAERVLKNEPQGIKDVLSEYQSLSDVGLIGSSLSFTINDDFLHCVVNVHDDSMIPKVRKKQLASGRLSESKMPQGEFNELFQDYVCSVAIRVAADLFAMLPISECYVTCQASMLNSSTGHLEDTPILSVFFVRDTLTKLGLGSIDPSDALTNFVHRMSFRRNNGFERTEPLRN